MPKFRKRANRKGAKSEAISIKNKMGGRKSGQGAGQMSNAELIELQSRVHKRDKNKLARMIQQRGIVIEV